MNQFTRAHAANVAAGMAGVATELPTGRLRLFGPTKILQQEIKIYQASDVFHRNGHTEWRDVPHVLED